MSFARKNVRILASSLGLVLLSPLAARAVDCTEYLNTVGRPTRVAYPVELSPAEIGALTKPKFLLSSEPLTHMNGDQLLSHFDNLPANEPQVLGIQTNRPFRRPDLPVVLGYMADFKNKTVETVPVAADRMVKPLLKTQGRMLLYGIMKTGNPFVVRLQSNEVIAAVARLDETKRLVATIREERTIGYRSSASKNTDSFLVELYHFEEAGYSVSAFHVPATSTYPTIKISSQEEKGVLLSVGDRDFHVQFRQPGQ